MARNSCRSVGEYRISGATIAAHAWRTPHRCSSRCQCPQPAERFGNRWWHAGLGVRGRTTGGAQPSSHLTRAFCVTRRMPIPAISFSSLRYSLAATVPSDSASPARYSAAARSIVTRYLERPLCARIVLEPIRNVASCFKWAPGKACRQPTKSCSAGRRHPRARMRPRAGMAAG
jgi:hypothetical protein